MPFAKVPGAGECKLYRRGHTLHPIQARLAWESDSISGCVLSIVDDIVTVASDDGLQEFQHHRIDQIRRAVATIGPSVELRSHGVLSFGTAAIFSVKVNDGVPVGACRLASLNA